MKEEPLRRVVSPDGKLTLVIFEEDDYLLGFEGQQWHTHGPLLVPQYGSESKQAALAFFDAVIEDREIICVSKRREKEEEVRITHDPEADVRYMEDGEVLQLRRWSGAELARHEKKD